MYNSVFYTKATVNETKNIVGSIFSFIIKNPLQKINRWMFSSPLEYLDTE